MSRFGSFPVVHITGKWRGETDKWKTVFYYSPGEQTCDITDV